MKSHRFLALAVLGLSLFAQPLAAAAQKYPDRVIKIVIPFGPGSGTDAIGRTLAKAISDEVGQTVIIDNKTGAQGIVGVQAVKAAAPDGYTILLSGSSSQVLNTFMFKDVPYDPIKDFVHVTPVGRTAMVLNVNAKSPYQNIHDLVTAAKKSPGSISFGSGSATTRLAGEYLAQRTGTKLLHVPYKTPMQALTDLMGDQLGFVFVDYPASGPNIKAGRLRPLAVTGTKRMAALPDTPTLEELGVKDFDLTAWYGLWLPAGTPGPVVNRLHEIVEKVMKTPAVREFFATANMEAFTMTPSEFQAFHKRELEKISAVVTAANLEKE